MAQGSPQLVVAFPISTAAFGLRSDWFENYSPKLIRPSILLMALLLVVSIGILALRRFEHADFEKKVWNIPILFTIVLFWPSLILGLKELVDTFDTFLVVNIFGIPWNGFGFPEIGSMSSIAAWPTTGLARLLPNLAYWVVYAFYIVFFFFYAALGPLILAKGILFDEIESFFELLKQVIILLLWQTTLVILVAFIMPSIVSGKPFPPRPESNFYFLSIILGVMIFFVPSLTNKFASQIEAAFVPLGFRWGGAMLGLAALGKVGAAAMTSAGVRTEAFESLEPWKDRFLKADEFKRRYEYRKNTQEEKSEREDLEAKLREFQREEQTAEKVLSSASGQGPAENKLKSSKDRLLALAKRAKEEMDNDDKPKV